MAQTILALLQGVGLVCLAPLVSGLSRWFRAKMHTRRGPSVLQDYYDIFKLIKRQDVHSNASGNVSRLMPALFLGTMVVLAMGMPMATRFCPVPLLGDAILIIYLLALPRFFFALSGIDSGSAYAGTGGVRELLVGTLVEPSLMLALFVTAVACGSTNVGQMGAEIAGFTAANPVSIVIAGVAFAAACYIEMGKLPYDFAEAEQELQEGPLAELSGPSLALAKLGISCKQVLVAALFVAIFLPFGSAAQMTLGGVVLGFVFFFVKMAVVMGVVMVVENVVARVRWKLAGHQTWLVVAIAVFALAFCMLGM